MKVAIVVFPGSNCEHDVAHALDGLGCEADLVWHRDTDLSDFDGVVLPGGFAHGDYLRTGAIARFSPVMAEVDRMANEGAPVLGICNGFQILTEAGLLPGVLLANRDLKFICRAVHLRVESTGSILTRAARIGDVLEIPLNSYEGNYAAHPATLDELAGRAGVILTYADAAGLRPEAVNPNGSTSNIAGITNEAGNVAGLMPHPERAVDPVLGSTDGRVLLQSFVTSVSDHAARRPVGV